MDLYNLTEIEIELREIADSICKNGLNNFLEKKGIPIEGFIKDNKKYNEDFIISCHTEFKSSQDRIIKNVVAIQAEQDTIKEQLKQARIGKQKKLVTDLINKEKHLGFTVDLFKHCADAIVWHLIQGQLWISRRLYLKVGGSKKLKESNLESAVLAAKEINSNPLNFVLITDVTNNVQVGDLIGFIDGNFTIIEVKEGQKNIEVLEIIDELSSNPTPAKSKEILDKVSEDPKFLEHLMRTLKQGETLENIHKILNTDKGIDPTTKKEIKIITPQENMPFYNKRLSNLEQQLDERKFWAYDVIEECLHIGIYKGEMRFGGSELLKAIAKGSNKPNIIIVDILNVIKSLNKPIFFLPFTPDFIFDLIFSRTKMYFMLDLDSYMELYKEFDLIAEWATKKETAKTNELAKGFDILKVNNRGIKIKSTELSKSETWLSIGTLSRIVFEHIYPSYMAYSAHYTIHPTEKEDDNKQDKTKTE